MTAIETADQRGFVLRVDRLEKVLEIIARFSGDNSDEDLVHRIRGAPTPRQDGYVVTITARECGVAGGARDGDPGSAEVNGHSIKCIGVIVSVAASWNELETRRAKPESSPRS